MLAGRIKQSKLDQVSWCIHSLANTKVTRVTIDLQDRIASTSRVVSVLSDMSRSILVSNDCHDRHLPRSSNEHPTPVRRREVDEY